MQITTQVTASVHCRACGASNHAVSNSAETARQAILRDGWLLTKHGELCPGCRHIYTLDREGAKRK